MIKIDLKNRREQHKISQRELAEKAGISKRQLIRIEAGAATSEQTKADIEAALEELQALKRDCAMDIIIDYVRIHFMTKDIRHVVENALRLPFAAMFRDDYAFYGFSEMYRIGDICVMASVPESEERYTLLELKGRGCRQFESHLQAQGRDWYDFFAHCLDHFQARIKRIDLAINDRDGLLSIPTLIQKCDVGECVPRWIRSFTSYKSGEYFRGEDRAKRETMGQTLYIGSPKSEIRFCIYEKDYEQLKKEGVPIDEAPIKNRFEVRLKNDHAFHAVEDLLVRQDAEQTVFDIINTYLSFVDGPPDAEYDRPLNARWAKFIGEGRGRVKLTTKPEPFTVERMINWMNRQVMPSVKFLRTLDKVHGTSVMQDMLDNATLSPRQVRFLKYLTTPPEDLVVKQNLTQEDI